MNRKRAHQLLGCAMLGTLLLSACDRAPLETRAGRWKASTEFGEVGFVVDASGTAITEIEFSLDCGGLSTSGTIGMEPSLPIDGMGEFSLDLPPISLRGEFDRSGSRASGFVSVGSCSGTWVSAR